MGTIYILWLRQLKKYKRSPARMVASVGQPLLFLLALGFGFGPIFQKAGGGNYIQFLAPGIIAMSILFAAMFSGIETIWDKRFGFLKETLVAPVSRFQIMAGRTLGGATVATFQGFVVLGISMLAGFSPSFSLLPFAIILMLLISLLFTALGTAIATFVEDMQAFPLIMNFLVMPTFFLSGALFPVVGSSGAIASIAKVNPLAYGVEGLRNTLALGTTSNLAIDFLVLGLLTIVLLALGTYFFKKMEA